MEQKTLKMNDILGIIEDLSRSQGFYGRLYERLLELQEEGGENWDNVVETFERQNFKDTLDLVLFLEA
jgi:hypothetical protein